MIDRRTFIRVSSAAAGGALIALYVEAPIRAQQPPAALPLPPDAFVHIRPDGRIVIQVNRIELGQGVHTALPMLLAEEMDADWSQVSAELAPAVDVYKDSLFQLQMTGASVTIAHEFRPYRELGAKTRAMLLASAAARWNVAPETCRARQSVVTGPNNQSARYADLAEDVMRQPVPRTVRLKAPSEFTLIGRHTRRLDSRSKCDGSQTFGLDVDLPRLRVAVIAHPPVFGGRVKAFDDANARTAGERIDIFEIPLVKGTGVAIVADRFWIAKQARDRLRIDWDVSNVEHPDTADLRRQYRELAAAQGLVAFTNGDAQAIDRIPAANRLVAEYEFPFLAHASMEPLNTTIRFDGDRAEAWTPTQLPTLDQIAIAQTLGIKQERVNLHTMFAGGGFGRRGNIDSHLQREAAEIAKRLRSTPIKLVWTREDDVRGGYYRPMCAHRVEIGIGPDGMPSAWRHVVVAQSLYEGTLVAAVNIKNGVDKSVVEGAADSGYAIPNMHVSAHQPKLNVPVNDWRAVGHTHSAFVMETLIDELAVRARVDPISFRRALLAPEAKKHRRALDLMDEKSARWRHALPKGHAVGIAVHETFGTAAACAVEVSVENGRPRIHRATAAIDVGVAVNPLTIESQVHGGLVFGLIQLMPKGAITLKDGEVEQRNFHDYTPAYMKDSPVAVDVHIVPSTEAPTGCGEPPVPIIAPAVANALFRLTGKRYRSLPLVSL
jgi:isoquinoline 1-oxidoreductase beta subunit